MKYILLIVCFAACGEPKEHTERMARLTEHNRRIDSLINMLNSQQPFRDTAFHYSKIHHEYKMKSLTELNNWVVTYDPKHRALYKKWDDSVDKYSALMTYYYAKVDSISRMHKLLTQF